MSPAPAEPSVFIGLGNALRGDDAAGLLVARALRDLLTPGVATAIEHEGEPVALLDLWEDAGAVLLADAVAAADPDPGAVHEFDALAGPLPASFGGPSTHAFGLAETVELGRALGRLPRSLRVFGIEGSRFETGASPSAPVADASKRLAHRIADELAR